MLKKKQPAKPASKTPARKPAVKKTVSNAVRIAASEKPAMPALPKEETAVLDTPVAATPSFSRKKYVAINEHDPDLQKKYRLVSLIIIAAVIFLAISWFFSLRYNVGSTINSFRNGEMKIEIDKLISRIKDDPQESGINRDDLAAIQEEIVGKINQSALNSSTWPVHQSELLGLEIRYPSNWVKQEITDTLTLSSYALNASAPSVFGQIKIKKLSEKKDSLADYLTPEQKNGLELDLGWTYLSGAPAIKYFKKDTGSDISWIIISGQGNRVFEIELFSKNGKGLYENLFSEILGTTKF